MKTSLRFALFTVGFALATGASAFAQGPHGPGDRHGPPHEPPALNADGTLTLPDGTVVTPNDDGSITLPDGHVIPPPPVRNPDGSITLPDGTVLPPRPVHNADGTITLPDGTIVTPNADCSITLPDGTVINPPHRRPGGRGPGPGRPPGGN